MTNERVSAAVSRLIELGVVEDSIEHEELRRKHEVQNEEWSRGVKLCDGGARIWRTMQNQ